MKSIEGSTPVSSGLYVTMRQRLSDSLTRGMKSSKASNVPLGTAFLGDVPYRQKSKEKVIAKGRDAKKAMVNLSLDALTMSPFDLSPVEDPKVPIQDVMDPVCYLSQRRCISAVKENSYLASALDMPKKMRAPLNGRLQNMLDIIGPTGGNTKQNCMFKRVIAGDGGKEIYVGPLSAREVAHLLILAQKLEEANRIDQNLKKDIESFSSMWKKTCTVPSVVSTVLVSGLYEGKPYQCVECGLRFASLAVLQVHATGHERPRGDLVWSSMTKWIKMPDDRKITQSEHQFMVSLRSIAQLLGKPRQEEPVSITWLKDALFPRGRVPENNGKEEAKKPEAAKVSEETPDNDLAALKGINVLWSWGIMKESQGIPTCVEQDTPIDKETEDLDRMLLQDVCNKVKINIARCLEKVPFRARYPNLTRQTCVFCYDPFHVEFDHDYCAFVYKKVVCFKIDHEYVRKCFNCDHVSLEALVGKEDIGSIGDYFSVLRKVACLKFVKSKLRSMRNSKYGSWSIREDMPIVEDTQIIPRQSDNNRDVADRVNYALTKSWKGPFASCGTQISLPNALLYAHLGCMKTSLNAHILRVMQLAAELPCQVDISHFRLI